MWTRDIVISEKTSEPTFPKTHWSYVMDEAMWMYDEYEKERKWKKRAAKAVIHIVAKYHRDIKDKQSRKEREEQQRMRKIASNIAKEVTTFWSNVEKIVMFKREGYVNARKKQILDDQLDQIVEQTEKFSNMLQEGMNNNESENENESELESEDVDLNTSKTDEQSGEISALKKESEVPIDELLSSVLPKDVLENLRKGSFLPQQNSESESESEYGSSTGSEEEISSDENGSNLAQDSESVPGTSQVSSNNSEAEATLVEGGSKKVKARRAEPEMNVFEKLENGSIISDESLDGTLLSNETPQESEASQDRLINDSNDKSDSKSVNGTDSKNGHQRPEPENGLKKSSNQNESQEMNSALDGFTQMAEQLQPKGYTYQSTEVKIEVPALLKNTKLREYQHIGLQWLVTMYEKKLNGILADEMGLGKTIQTVALLAYLACNEQDWGPHLIVVPTSVMLNWEIEFKKWCPGFKVLTYYGSIKERKQKRRGWMGINAFNICITSYKLVIQDAKCFKTKRWRYLVLDEAQNIKNFKSQRWQVLLNFPCEWRLLLTGTPLQNSLMELWSLLHFLMPSVFENHRDFKEWFSNPLTGMIEGSQEYNEKLVARLHKVLRPFLLRRIKDEVEKQMPKKYEHVIKCRLSKRQRFLYDDFMSRATTKNTLATGHFMSVINVLMQLRKVCNHPDMFEPRPIVTPFSCEAIEIPMPSLVVDLAFQLHPLKEIDLKSHFSLFSPEYSNHHCIVPCSYETILQADEFVDRSIRVKTQLPEAFISQTLGSFSVSQIMSFEPDFSAILDDQKVVTQKIRLSSGKNVVKIVPAESKCASNVTSSRFRSYESSMVSSRRQILQSIAKISCRKCSLISCTPNIVDESLVKYLRRSIFVSRKSSFNFSGFEAVRKICLFNYDSSRARRNLYFDCCPSLVELVPSTHEVAERLDFELKTFLLYIPRAVAKSASMYSYRVNIERLNSESLLRFTCSETLQKSSYLQLPLSRSQALFPETRLIQYDCGKLQTLDVLLKQLKSESHRVLIFTQMTKMLDILETFLNYHGHRYLRLDGSTKIEQRQYLMERFNTDSKIFVFILSTRSGGIGVNLTGADTVIFYDSDWNPTVDSQAQDRCHRIGQTRDVHIYRLISDRTVEENIVKKATQKRLLGDLAIEHGNFNAAFFQQNSIKELFDVDQPNDTDSVTVGSQQSRVEEATEGKGAKNSVGTRKAAEKLQEVLSKVEDAQDVDACKLLEKEQVAELAEFNENEEDSSKTAFCSEVFANVDREVAEITEKLSSVERYAFNYVENCLEPLTPESIENAVHAALFAQKNQGEHQKSNKLQGAENENGTSQKNTKKKPSMSLANTMRSSSRIALNKEREEFKRSNRECFDMLETDSDSSRRVRKRARMALADAENEIERPSRSGRGRRSINNNLTESTPKRSKVDKVANKKSPGRKPRIVLHSPKESNISADEELVNFSFDDESGAETPNHSDIVAPENQPVAVSNEILDLERKYPARKRVRVKYEDYVTGNQGNDAVGSAPTVKRKAVPVKKPSVTSVSRSKVSKLGSAVAPIEILSSREASLNGDSYDEEEDDDEEEEEVDDEDDEDEVTEIASSSSSTIPYGLSDVSGVSSLSARSVGRPPVIVNRFMLNSGANGGHSTIRFPGYPTAAIENQRTLFNSRAPITAARYPPAMPVRVPPVNASLMAHQVASTSNGASNIFQMFSNGMLDSPVKNPVYYPPQPYQMPSLPPSLQMMPGNRLAAANGHAFIRSTTFSHVAPSLPAFSQPPRIISTNSSIPITQRPTYIIKQTSIPTLRIPNCITAANSLMRAQNMNVTRNCLPPTLIRQPSSGSTHVVRTPRFHTN